MKKITWLFLLLPFFALSQEKSGIQFQNSSWTQVLAKAKAEKKIIFMDAYTTWCGPCKKMASDVFTDESVGKFFNNKFINTKFDMEKGEGETIAERYGVHSYPTFLFINGDGKLLHKAIGYREAADFIQTGETALDPSRQFYTLKDKYKSGNIGTDLHYTLAMTASELEDDAAGEIANSYLGKQTTLLTEKNINLILATTTDPAGKYFDYLSKNEKAAGAIVGADKIRDGLDMIAYRHIADEIGESDAIPAAVAKVENLVKKYRPAGNARRLSYQFGMYMAEQEENETLRKDYLVKYLDNYGSELDWQKLNEYAWNFFEEETDQKLLRSALGWALESVKKDSNFYNNDTVANLYDKLGNKKDAKKYAETALKLGKAAGEDMSETEALLKRLN